MTRDYTLRDIKTYMRERYKETSTGGFFEYKKQSDCREELESLSISPDSGKGLLFTFATIAGGWKLDVGSRLVGGKIDGKKLEDDFETISNVDLKRVDEAGYGGHPHRHANGAYPSKALKSLSTLNVENQSVSSMSDLFASILESEQSDAEPFDVAYETFKDVKTFRGLAAFDYLEFAVRVNGQDELVPDQLKVAYVDRNGPGKTLARIIENREDATSISQSEEAPKILHELVDFAKSELGLSHTAAFFDVESCLCTYHGELENEGPDWRGSCT
ncbi:hypothetical protein ACNO8S_02540 [Haloarcula sp. KBTZ06]|uniref:ADDT family thymidine hypermodification transferase n=1 Tax=Haloarcula sp. KBTZ06 TaxID=3402682 RepID=UPI003B433687